MLALVKGVLASALAVGAIGHSLGAEKAESLGIGVHVLPYGSTVTAGAFITVENDETFDVDVLCLRRDTSATVFSGTVQGLSSDSWEVEDALVGVTLRTSVYYANTTTLITYHDHLVVE